MEVFGLRAIAKRVTEQKISHKQLAEICGVSDSTISSWLSGKTYEEHVELAKKLDAEGKLPATFMVMAPGSWTDEVWDDINRMRTLNAEQRRRDLQMHVCPLQLDIIERLINRYSNEGEVVLDPFGGIMSVPERAVRMGRHGIGIELSADYFRDGVGYLKEAERERDVPTLFDLMEAGA